jgi:hypothetical protein
MKSDQEKLNSITKDPKKKPATTSNKANFKKNTNIPKLIFSKCMKVTQ